MKNASARASLAPTVRAAHLAAAITAAASMGIREKERVCDRIYAAQANLLGSVLALRLLGVSTPTIDILLNILIVLYLAIEESGQVLEIVSEADQERELPPWALPDVPSAPFANPSSICLVSALLGAILYLYFRVDMSTGARRALAVSRAIDLEEHYMRREGRWGIPHA
jgi:hypothetical protein